MSQIHHVNCALIYAGQTEPSQIQESVIQDIYQLFHHSALILEKNLH